MSDAAWPIVCATAHRQLPADAVPWVRERLTACAVWLRDERGTRVGVSGMARGGDLLWSEAVLAAGLDLHAYVPYRSQPDRWDPADRDRWADLIGKAARVVVCNPDPPDRRTAVRYLHARNDMMLAASSAVVAVLRSDATSGGTVSAVRKAWRLGLPGVHLDPTTRRTRVVESGDWLARRVHS